MKKDNKKTKTKETKNKEIKAKETETKIEKESTKDKKSNSKRKYIFLCIGIVITIVLIVVLAVCLKDKSKATIRIDSKKDDIYKWEYEIENNKIVKLDKRDKVGENDKQDNMYTEIYTFKALKPGKTIIKFTFVNINNKSYLDVKRYEVNVDKKNHIKIEKIS